jgi:hypothetical protein
MDSLYNINLKSNSKFYKIRIVPWMTWW